MPSPASATGSRFQSADQPPPVEQGMAGELSTPHDNLFRSVFGDIPEASALPPVSQREATASHRTAGVVSGQPPLASRPRVLGAVRPARPALASAALRAPLDRPDHGTAGPDPRRAARSHRATGDDGRVPGELAPVAAVGAAAGAVGAGRRNRGLAWNRGVHAATTREPQRWHRFADAVRRRVPGGFYASVFYSYFAALGYDIAVEESSSNGRLDMAVRTAGHVFLFDPPDRRRVQPRHP